LAGRFGSPFPHAAGGGHKYSIKAGGIPDQSWTKSGGALVAARKEDAGLKFSRIDRIRRP